MSDMYIKPKKAFTKIKQANGLTRPVYIFGASGFGKTSLALSFLSKKSYTYISCQNDKWNISGLLDHISSKRITNVVIDDLQYLTNVRCQEELISLIENENVWTVMICRSRMPSWLTGCYFRRSFTLIGESDLCLGTDEAKQLFKETGADILPEKLEEICTVSRGNPFVLRCIRDGLAAGCTPDESLSHAINIYTKHILENVMSFFDSDVIDFLVKISIVESFDVQMANMITSRSDSERIISRCEELGSFICSEGPIYRLRPEYASILDHYKKTDYNPKLLTDCYYNAGIYYSINGRDEKAIEMFAKSGNTEKVKEILIRNSVKVPGEGYYYEMRTYYHALDESDIESSVILMAGVSMMYSLMMNPQKSEYWFGRLKEKAETLHGTKKNEALAQISYLEIAIPHRGSEHILDSIIKNYNTNLHTGVSVSWPNLTSNMPSIMNGGKDFCRWSRQDDYISETYGSMISSFFGGSSTFINETGLAESYYEKGKDPSAILKMLSHITVDSGTDDRADLEFAVCAVRSKLYLSSGDIESALSCMEGFGRKMQELRFDKIHENVRAFICMLKMFTEDSAAVDRWFESAPDEDNDFFILDRFKYMVKIRCYITRKKYLRAFSLIEKMKNYAHNYDRKYISMELGILSSILNYRCGKPWKEEFTATLEEISSYDFIRIISVDGAAVLPLLREVYGEYDGRDQRYADWLFRVLEETERMASAYPLYMKAHSEDIPAISGNAKKILYLQAQGRSLSEIAYELDMKESTIKYHIKENYRKLEVNNKIDAVMTAKRLGVI